MAAAAAIAAAWLAAAPPVADLAAHSFRAWLWDDQGFAVFNLQWYGGHHVPGYSLLFPPLAGVLGASLAVALAGLASVAALVALGREAAPQRPVVAWLLASGAAANLLVGRGPFALGLAAAATAVLLARRERTGGAAALSLVTAAASPVAALFLVLIAAAWPRRRIALALGAPAVGCVAALVALFPEGGAERFVATAFWPMLALTLAAAALLGGRWRAAALLYAGLLALAFAVETPLGQNATRLGVLAGPAVLALAGRGPRAALVLVGAALLYLQALPAVRAVAEARGDPAAAAVFHAPLLEFLRRAAAPGDRLEIAFTRNHWEAAHVAPRFALARGWERQLDLEVNRLFYDGRPLTAGRYEAWLRAEAIRWVALPDAPLDFSSRAEARLLRRGPPYLRPAFVGGGWRVWELRGAPAAVDGPAHVTATGPQRIDLLVERPGRVLVRRRHSPYLRLRGLPGCLRATPEGLIELRADGAGAARIEATLGPPASGCS